MDKETLSNYGWIVICTLVLAVMIALATPFGEYIKAGVWSTTNGLNDTLNKNMEIAGLSGGSGDSDLDSDNEMTGDNFNQYKLIPKAGTTGIVDEERGYIYGIPERTKDLTAYFEVTNGGYMEVSQNDIPRPSTFYGTGSKIIVYTDSTKSKMVKEYTAVVFGDADQNGLINGNDVTQANCHYHGTGTLTGATFTAGDVNADGVINDDDVKTILYHSMGRMLIPVDVLVEKDGDYYPKYSLSRDLIVVDTFTQFVDCPDCYVAEKSQWTTQLDVRTSLNATLKFRDGTTQNAEFITGEIAGHTFWAYLTNPDVGIAEDYIMIGQNYNMDYAAFETYEDTTHDVILVSAVDKLVNLVSMTVDGKEIVFGRLTGGEFYHTEDIFENTENVKDVVFTFESGRQKRIELTEGCYNDPNSMNIVEIGSDGCGFYLQGDAQDKVKFVTFTETINGVDVSKTCSFSTYETNLDCPW